jgi:hypothetical protein
VVGAVGGVVARVDEVGAVVEVGLVVGVSVGAVVGVVGPAWSAVMRLVITVDGGLGMVALAGTNAMVMSWPFSNSKFCGSPGVSAPCLAVKFGQL